MMTRLLLKNANVVLPDREDAVGVLIEEGRISAIGDSLDAAEEIDLAGATLLPGFIDVHIHGAAGVDVMDATAAGLRGVSEYLASEGVTSWVPTFVPASDEHYASAIAVISEAMRGQGPGARVLGCRLEERELQFGLERCYRALARLAGTMEERIELVDRANAIRPRTLT